MQPRNKKNFLIEVTPEVMAELNRLYMYSDEDPVAELYYSPYWIKQSENSDQGEK